MTMTNTELTKLRAFFEKLEHRCDGVGLQVAELDTRDFFGEANLYMSISPASSEMEEALAAKIKSGKPVVCGFEERVDVFERDRLAESINLETIEENNWVKEGVVFDWEELQRDPAGAAEEYKLGELHNRGLTNAVKNYREHVAARWADFRAA